MRINGRLTRTKVLSLRIPGSEHASLKELADERKTTISRLMQPALRGMVINRGAFLDEIAIRLGDLTQQVAAVGRNLNQIARAINKSPGRVNVDPKLFQRVREENAAVIAYLLQLKKEEEGRWVNVADIPELERSP